MFIALHFFKRDVRRAAWHFSLLLLLCAVEGAFALAATPPSPHANFAALLFPADVVFSVLHVLVLAILVPRIIQQDSLLGDTAFWQTRPISRSSLLLAKLMGLSLAVLIPMVVNGAVLVEYGLPPAEFVQAEAEILMGQLLIVIPMAVLAGLTGNIVRFALVAVVAFSGIGAALAFMRVPISSGAGPFASLALVESRALAAAIVVVAGGAVILVHQYLTRATSRSVLLAGFITVVYVLVAGFWPWTFKRDRLLQSNTTLVDPAKTEVHAGISSVNSTPRSPFGGFVGKNIDGSYSLDGLTPDLSVQVRSASPTLFTEGGATIPTLGTILTVPFGQFELPPTSAISAALGGIPVRYFYQGKRQTTFVTLDPATFLKFKDAPAKLVDDLDLVVSRYEIVAELPLVRGSIRTRGTERWAISEVINRSDGVTLVVAETSVNSRFDSGRAAGTPTDPRLRGDPVYALVNRERKEALLTNPTIQSSSVRATRLGGLIVLQNKELPFGGEGVANFPRVDDAWLAGATLVRIERVPVSEFRKTLTLDLPKLGEPWRAWFPAAATAIAPHRARAVINPDLQRKAATHAEIIALIESEILSAAYVRLHIWELAANGSQAIKDRTIQSDDRNWITAFASLIGKAAPSDGNWSNLSPPVEFLSADGRPIVVVHPRRDRVGISHGGQFDVYLLPPDVATKLSQMLTEKGVNY